MTPCRKIMIQRCIIIFSIQRWRPVGRGRTCQHQRQEVARHQRGLCPPDPDLVRTLSGGRGGEVGPGPRRAGHRGQRHHRAVERQ